MYDIPIGAVVARARIAAGLTQRQLAERAGTSQSAVARLERGGVSPTLSVLERLAAAAGCDVRIEFVPMVTLDPVVEAYKRDIDRTLLRDNLGKTVNERLQALESMQELSAELRRAVQAKKGHR